MLLQKEVSFQVSFLFFFSHDSEDDANRIPNISQTLSKKRKTEKRKEVRLQKDWNWQHSIRYTLDVSNLLSLSLFLSCNEVRTRFIIFILRCIHFTSRRINDERIKRLPLNTHFWSPIQKFWTKGCKHHLSPSLIHRNFEGKTNKYHEASSRFLRKSMPKSRLSKDISLFV